MTAISVALPTLIRVAIAPEFDDRTCTVFCPFVLLTVILCGGRYAVAAATGSAIACNTILMGHPYSFHFDKAQIEGLATFLAYSLFLIAVVGLFRSSAARSLRQAGAKERESAIVFSLDGGQAWASWYGVDAPVRLGPPELVVPMMEDFIAQMKVAERLQAHEVAAAAGR